jgi:Secretion system C-terminal sorting domain/Polysaccharide deacetylase
MNNPNLRSVLVVLLTLYFCSPHAQNVILNLQSTPTATPTVTIAALKYNKDFAYSFTLDDANSDAYTVAAPLLRGGLVPGSSGYTSPGMFYTDGCNNDLAFKAGIAWNSANQYGTDVHTGNVPELMTWTQLDQLYGYGWDVLNHSFTHKAKLLFPSMTTSDYLNEINQNRTDVRQKTAQQVEMPMFVVPTGDYNYQPLALQQGHKAVFDQNSNTANGEFLVGYNGLQIDGNVNLSGLRLFRQNLDEVMQGGTNKLNQVAAMSNSTTHYWYNDFTHRIDNFANLSNPLNFNNYRNYLLAAAATYGKNGSDRMWMAPLQEVYEYLTARQNTTFTVSVNASNQLNIAFNFNAVPAWLRRKVLTLVVQSSADFATVSTTSGVLVTSYRGTGSTKILNIDFSGYQIPTPVELLRFSGRAKGKNTALLTWATASELRFKGFEVQKSTDNAKTFEKIAFVAAKGSASVYELEDADLQQLSYYRLKNVDDDGSFVYSNVISVLPNSEKTVRIFPSVATENTVTLETDFSPSETAASVRITDVTGKLWLTQTLNTATQMLDIVHLPTGVYFVRVEQGAYFWVNRLVKL